MAVTDESRRPRKITFKLLLKSCKSLLRCLVANLFPAPCGQSGHLHSSFCDKMLWSVKSQEFFALNARRLSCFGTLGNAKVLSFLAPLFWSLQSTVLFCTPEKLQSCLQKNRSNFCPLQETLCSNNPLLFDFSIV